MREYQPWEFLCAMVALVYGLGVIAYVYFVSGAADHLSPNQRWGEIAVYTSLLAAVFIGASLDSLRSSRLGRWVLTNAFLLLTVAVAWGLPSIGFLLSPAWLLALVAVILAFIRVNEQRRNTLGAVLLWTLAAGVVCSGAGGLGFLFWRKRKLPVSLTAQPASTLSDAALLENPDEHAGQG